MNRFAYCFLLVFLTISSSAQVKVESSLSAVEILVGQQVELNVSATTPQNAQVEFPKEGLIPMGVEFLGAIEKEPEMVEDGKVRHSRSYVLTSFDDTLYYLPPLTVKVDGKDYQTNKLALKVLTVDVDTTNYEKYYGPHDVQSLPMSWSQDDWSLAFWLSAAMIFLLLVVLYLFVRLKSNKPIVSRIRIIKRLLPHQKAMKAIEMIKADRMSTAEDSMEYYTRLTDTLRQYINERYGFNATEMTSSEIIERLTKTDDPKSLEELRQLFETADLVKFAKYSTMMNENDANLVSAVDFINQTKLENMPTEEVVKPELTTEQIQSKARRKGLIAAIAILALAIVGLLVYIGWIVYDVLLY